MRSGRKLKVLFITEFLPWPLNSGGRIRSYHILRQVASRHDVTLIAADYDGVEKYFSNMVSKLYVAQGEKHKLSKWLFLFLSLFNPKPFVHVFSCYNKLILNIINREMRLMDFDIIHLDHLDAAIYLSAFKDKESKVYLDEHNFETHLINSLRNSEKNLFWKIYLKNQMKKIQKFEVDTLNRVDAVGVVSSNDAEMIKKFVKKDKVSIIPNGVDINFFSIDRTPEPYSLIYVGSLDWRPNVEGIIWFLQNVWPRLIKEKPKSHFWIVGRNPQKELYRYIDEQVNIAASVYDVREYVKRAAVFIVPLFSGGGTRLKILEAMAMRIPVVSTSKGAEGIECKNNLHICIADNKDLFLKSIIALFEKERFASGVSRAAYDLVKAKYSWDAIGEQLENVYQRLVI